MVCGAFFFVLESWCILQSSYRADFFLYILSIAVVFQLESFETHLVYLDALSSGCWVLAAVHIVHSRSACESGWSRCCVVSVVCVCSVSV